VLLDWPVSLDDIEPALNGFDIRSRRDMSESWEFGGPTLVLDYRPESNGMIVVDVVDRCWPDLMGDPKNEPRLFAAWSMGQFGPFAFPGGLQRAGQQCWSWEGGRTIASRHKAFIRIRSTYLIGGSGESPVMPDDYEAMPELEFVTKMASAILEIPGALCYFNPSGEVVRDGDHLRESLNYAWTNGLPPLSVWSNIRLFKLNPEWSLMDTVGNSQLDIPDIEACFHSESFEPNEVDNFLRNVSLYLIEKGEVIKDGDTMDGPGEIHWQSRQFENGISDPPRRVLRWLPLDNRQPPREIVNSGSGA